MKVLDSLIQSIRSAQEYNPDVQAAPCCILWPDKDHQWEGAIEVLQKHMEELFILGNYEPEHRKGTAIWLRCVIAGLIDPWTEFSDGKIPVVYLPGISRSELRIVEQCPDKLKPIIELQYRGTYWSQQSSKDWTPYAFLSSCWGGLGLSVSKDSKTRKALQQSLHLLLNEDVKSLSSMKLIDADTINSIAVPDLPKLMLQFINDGESFRESVTEHTWNTFCALCDSSLSFHPESEGYLAAAKALAVHEGAWRRIWERFIDTYSRYQQIYDRIKSCTMPVKQELFVELKSVEGWPQYTETEEEKLLQALNHLEGSDTHTVRKKILELEESHRERCNFIWSEMGYAPLAEALKHLAELAESTEKLLIASDVETLKQNYCQHGWKADDAFLKACASVQNSAHEKPVLSAAKSLYLPWADDGAGKLQKLSLDYGYPAVKAQIKNTYPEGTCVLFVDGFRYDVSQRLKKMLEGRGYIVDNTSIWAAFPTLTSTGKPAVSPVAHLITGREGSVEGYPQVVDGGQSLEGGYYLKKLLKDAGWSVLESSENGDGNGFGWTETGDIDHEGHAFGWKLVQYLDVLVEQIYSRITDLLNAGWQQVQVVTDHGWLLLPGGLPKEELSGVLTEHTYGRCAVIKPGAMTEVGRLGWYWNPEEIYAFAPGIHAFKHGEVYAHGGVSLQESIIPEFVVTASSDSQKTQIQITEITWKGLRCSIEITARGASSFSGDMRLKATDASTSVVFSIKQFRDDGFVSLAVENEDLEGTSAYIVVLDANGDVIAQEQTKIGEGR